MAVTTEGREGAEADAAAEDAASADGGGAAGDSADGAVSDGTVAGAVGEGTGSGDAVVGTGGSGIGGGRTICIVDFPPALLHHAAGSGSGTAIWRRLLLGERDGGAVRGNNQGQEQGQGQGQGAYYSMGNILGYGISTFLGGSSSHDGSLNGSVGSSNNGGNSASNGNNGSSNATTFISDKDVCGEESYSAHCDPQSVFADVEKIAVLEVIIQ